MGFTFIKSGKESAQLAEQAAKEAELRKESQGKLFRFFLTEIKGTSKFEEATITFVDGDLSEEGYLLPPRWYEHTMFLKGNWENFVCPEKTNPNSGDSCPLCESGDRASLVAGFTVIDHRQYKSKKGELYQNTRKLLIAKPQSFEMLNKLATTLEGLAGGTFKVSRTGDKSPSIGNMFIPMGKKPVEELQSIYMREVTDPKTNQKSKTTYFIPADYDTEIIYRTGKELNILVGGKEEVPSSSGKQDSVDYSKLL